MKVLVLSDSHGDERKIEQLMEDGMKADMMLHLGDVCGSADYIEALCQCPARIIAGNNDYGPYLDPEMIFELEGKRIWMTHGHEYRIRQDLDGLFRMAKINRADIVLFGHIHIPVLEEREGIVFFNPGSISLPRQENHRCSYGIIEIDEKKEFSFHIHYI